MNLVISSGNEIHVTVLREAGEVLPPPGEGWSLVGVHDRDLDSGMAFIWTRSKVLRDLEKTEKKEGKRK